MRYREPGISVELIPCLGGISVAEEGATGEAGELEVFGSKSRGT